LILFPEQGDPQQLFVLVHGEAAGPQQLLPLAQACKKTFVNALVVLPYGPVLDDNGQYGWLEPDRADRGEAALPERVAHALPALIDLVRGIQARYGLSGEQTALAGFAEGAMLVLEACSAQPGLAGRALAFSGRYARLPPQAPPVTTLHLLHGAADRVIPADRAREAHAHLAELRGDATLDIASTVGHELHEALIRQALHRLQTCVPLRSWEAALSELGPEPEGRDEDGGDPAAGGLPGDASPGDASPGNGSPAGGVRGGRGKPTLH
jgi:phospholipase/carboxylesterase